MSQSSLIIPMIVLLTGNLNAKLTPPIHQYSNCISMAFWWKFYQRLPIPQKC